MEVTVTYLLIVRDVERSVSFYRDVLGAEPIRTGTPSFLRLGNGLLILSTEGGPTDDKPGIFARAPTDPGILSSALNLRVSDIHGAYDRWSSAGATFLTPPREHDREIRCYLRDPDGHLIEVGQAKQPEDMPEAMR